MVQTANPGVQYRIEVSEETDGYRDQTECSPVGWTSRTVVGCAEVSFSSSESLRWSDDGLLESTAKSECGSSWSISRRAWT